MNVSFLHAGMLPFLFLVGAPLLVHLLSRARPPVYRFPSVVFIRRLVRSARRIRRPQDLLLLLLRTLIVLFLIGVFLRPLYFGDTRLSSAGERRTVILVVDATASMGYVEAAQTRFAAACAEASDILAGLRPGDRANVVWQRPHPEAVFPAPGINHQRLRDALRRGQVSQGSGDVRSAVRMAVDMLADAEGAREILMISDFQSSTWDDIDLDIPAGIAFATVQPDVSRGENMAIVGLHTEPREPLVGESARLYARVRNFSDAGRAITVFTEAGEKRERQELMLEPWGDTTVVSAFRAPRAGALSVAAAIGEDRFAPDNRRETVVDVRPYLRVGVLGADRETLGIWHEMLEALEWVRIDALTWADHDAWQACDAVMVTGWDAEHADGLHRLLVEGRTVIWWPGMAGTPAQLDVLLGNTGPAGAATSPWSWQTLATPMALRVGMVSDRLFNVFAEGEYGDPAAGTFNGRLLMGTVAWDDAEVLLRYEDDVPALMRLPGAGMLVLWNMAVAPSQSSWSLQPESVPLLGEVLLTARTRRGGRGRVLMCGVGESPTCTLDVDVLASELRLEDARRERFEVTRHDREGGALYVAGQVEVPGVYRWMLQNETLRYSVVEFPSRESDLRCLAVPNLEQRGWRAVRSGRALRDLHEGVELWPILLGLAMLALVAEGATCWWAAKT